MRIKADKFDIGDVILQEKVTIDEDTKAIDLYNKLSELSADLLIRCLRDLDNCLERSVKQNDDEATKAFKIKPGENRIRWKEMDLRHVYKLYRAFDGFSSPIYTNWTNHCKMKLFNMIRLSKMLQIQNEINDEFGLDSNDLEPGTIKYSKHKRIICIKCKDNWAGFEAVCLKGHRKISSKQFNNGYLLKVAKECNQIVLDDE